MDTRLVMTILFVAAIAVKATTAQSTPVTSVNATTGTLNTTLVTSANVTTVTGNAAPATSANATTGTGNAAPATSANATTGTGNTTTGTTTAAATTVGPLTQNTTVDVLNTTLSSTGCGSQSLCLSQPTSCDPSTSSSCYFLSAQQVPNSQNFNFGLSGNSTGYIALTLSSSGTVGNNDTTYVCANNNGVVKFFATLLYNGVLTVTNLNVNSVKGKVNGNKIQCTFAATVPVPSTKATAETVQVSTGTYNSTTGSLGTPSVAVKAAVTDLGSVNTTVTYSNTTSSTNTTTSHAITFQQSLTQTLLITAGMLGMAMF